MVNDPGRPSGGGGRGTEHVVPFYSKGGPRKNKGRRPPRGGGRGGGRGAEREIPFYRQGGPQQSQHGPSPSRGGEIGMESEVPFYRQGGPLVSQCGPRPLRGGRMEDDSRRGGVVGNGSKFIKGKVLKHHEEMCTVHVSNLPSEMTDESIKELEEFISHQTGGRNLLSSTLSHKSEGNLELTCVFKSKKFAKLCIKKVPKKLFHGHRLLVSSVRGHSNYCVKVTNISKLSTEEALRELFESCGQIKMIHINDAKPGCTRDALISFVGPEDSVTKALKLDGAELGPYHIQVMQHNNGKGMDQMSKTLGAHIKPKSMSSKGMNEEEEVEEKFDLRDRICSIMGKPKSASNKVKDEEIEEGEEATEDEEIEEGEEATEDEEIEGGEEAEESVEVTEDEEVSGDEEVTEDDKLTEDKEIEDSEEITEDEKIEEGEEVQENAEVTEETDEDKEAKDASDEEDDGHQKELKDIENMVKNWTDEDEEEEEAEKDQDRKSRIKNYLKETKSNFKKQMNKPKLSKSSNVGKILQQQSSNIGLKRKRNDMITMKGRKKAKPAALML